MKVYHTAYEEIKKPDVSFGRKNADLGAGFYVSFSDSFASKWGRRKKGSSVYVNSYELDTEGLKVLRLTKDRTWLRYIRRNRAGYPDLYGDYDIIIGPVANDTVYDMFGLITSSLLDEDTALELLKLGPEMFQMAVKSRRAAERMDFLSSYVIDDETLLKNAFQLKVEETEDQDLVSSYFEEMK